MTLKHIALPAAYANLCINISSHNQ